MAINITTLTEDEFYSQLADLIGQLEGNRLLPYCDTGDDKNPTIGIGFNLRITDIRNKVFEKMGITDDTKRTALATILLDTTITKTSKLRSQLNAELGTTFKMTKKQIKAVYKSEIEHYYTAKSISELISDANTGKGLFAMHHLAPFVSKNQNEAEYSAIDPAQHSDNYKKDRARFLYYSINPGGLVFDQKEKILFEDLALVENENGYNEYDHAVANNHPAIPAYSLRKYTFGTNHADTIDGEPHDDHLYGMDGNDTIEGYHGNDYIEDGKGQDVIQGSTENDTIRVHNFTDEDTVEIIDGGAGENIIPGTDMSDIIDLSGTTLTSIKEIRGGKGVGAIIGSAGDDKIYGEAGMDILSGGDEINSLYFSDSESNMRMTS